MADHNNDKKNQTTEQQGEGSQQQSGNERAEGAAQEDTSTLDRDAGTLEHGETGGHDLKSESA